MYRIKHDNKRFIDYIMNRTKNQENQLVNQRKSTMGDLLADEDS